MSDAHCCHQCISIAQLTNILCTLLLYIFTARQHSCYAERCTMVIIDSVCLPVCLSVRHTLASCQNSSSYDHAVRSSLEHSPMTLVSSWLTSARYSEENIGNGGA